jgi:transforming growth factor-beta-induced protein
MRFAVTTALLLATAVSPLRAQHADIVRTARDAGQFATLLAAVEAAGLTSTLRGDGPFTVFAPTDEAFRKLPAGTVENLLKPENRDQLRAILLYHVVPGRVPASAARELTRATTVEGRALRIAASGNALRINGSTVVKADVGASNGVIHVIDAVLMPTDAPASGTGAGAGAATYGVSSQSARGLITLAIARGAPLYNNGQSAATIAVYEVAARGVLALPNGIPMAARARLEQGLREADRTREEDDRAWVLREALDDAARLIEGRRMMTVNDR